MTFIVHTVSLIKWLYKRETLISEAISGFSTAGWGVLFILAYMKSRVWPSMYLTNAIFDSYLWGVGAILLGVAQIIICRVIDKNWRKPWARWVAALLSAWLWGAVCSSTWLYDDGVVPTMSAAFGVMVANLFLVSRIFGLRD